MFKRLVVFSSLFISSFAFAEDAGAPVSIRQLGFEFTNSVYEDPVAFRKECAALNKLQNVSAKMTTDPIVTRLFCDITSGNETVKVSIAYNSDSSSARVSREKYSDKSCGEDFLYHKSQVKNSLLKKVNESQLEFLTAEDNDHAFGLKQNVLTTYKTFFKDKKTCEITTIYHFEEEP